VFIRAPQILGAGPGVEPLAWYRCSVVHARQKNILAATFHPELTDDTRIHGLFLQLFDRKAR
jgi:5'-phosphate synthase pdxT subunit